MKIIKCLIILLTIILLTWLLPVFYNLLLPTQHNSPFVLYSELDSSFISLDFKNGDMVITDFKGNRFNKHQSDSLLPFFFYRQLIEDGTMPDSILGHPVSIKDIQTHYFYLKTSPRQLNRPPIGLYTLFESASGNVDLYLPPDVFRTTETGLEFIDCQTNTVLINKSLLFTNALKEAGFVFPVKLIWGNASTHKDYDNGFLLTDSNGGLFQLKMIKSKPFVLPIQTEVRHWQLVLTVEPANHDLLGLAVDKNNRLYVVKTNGTTVLTGIDEYDPNAMPISIIGNMLTWTIALSTEHDTRYYAIDAQNYKLISKAVVDDPEPTPLEKMQKILLPLRLYFQSWRSQYIFPHYNEF